MAAVTSFPLPGMGRAAVAGPAPGSGPGHWVGAPSAALDRDGTFVVAYRVRVTDQRGAATVVARSADGERLTTVAILDKARFGAMSMERPALVRTRAGRWHAWICCHPLDQPGEEDRMTTAYATSEDGLVWDWHGTALVPRPGTWDARGTRVTAVLPDGRATYDGRASKEENFSERTGLAHPTGRPGELVQDGHEPVSDARYLDVVPLPDGGYRLYYEFPLADQSHELRTELVPAT